MSSLLRARGRTNNNCRATEQWSKSKQERQEKDTHLHNAHLSRLKQGSDNGPPQPRPLNKPDRSKSAHPFEIGDPTPEIISRAGPAPPAGSPSNLLLSSRGCCRRRRCPSPPLPLPLPILMMMMMMADGDQGGGDRYHQERCRCCPAQAAAHYYYYRRLHRHFCFLACCRGQASTLLCAIHFYFPVCCCLPPSSLRLIVVGKNGRTCATTRWRVACIRAVKTSRRKKK